MCSAFLAPVISLAAACWIFCNLERLACDIPVMSELFMSSLDVTYAWMTALAWSTVRYWRILPIRKR